MLYNTKTKPKILIVEDEAIIALDLRIQLEKSGYHAVMAQSVKEALDSIEKRQPDLALMDINLKGTMDGVDLAKLIRSQYSIPVVFLTAYNYEHYKEKLESVESFHFLCKPLNATKLFDVVENVLAQTI